jgi:hypothetical protein
MGAGEIVGAEELLGVVCVGAAGAAFDACRFDQFGRGGKGAVVVVGSSNLPAGGFGFFSAGLNAEG